MNNWLNPGRISEIIPEIFPQGIQREIVDDIPGKCRKTLSLEETIEEIPKRICEGIPRGIPK